MNWVDAAMLLVLLFFIVTGFQNGFIREILALASAIFGVVLAGLLFDDVADSLFANIDNQATANVIAFLLIFGGVALAGQLLAQLIHPMAVVMQLGVFDQLLGTMFGAVKGFVIIEVLLILMVTYPRYDMDKRIDEARFAPKMLDLAGPLTSILPDQFEAAVNAFKDNVLLDP